MVTKNSGYLIQGNFGTKCNFEVVRKVIGARLEYWWRNNDDPTLPWIYRDTFAPVVPQT
jgi:hypothetical protein